MYVKILCRKRAENCLRCVVAIYFRKNNTKFGAVPNAKCSNARTPGALEQKMLVAFDAQIKFYFLVDIIQWLLDQIIK